MKQTLKNLRVASGKRIDLSIQDGMIQQVGTLNQSDANEIHFPKDLYVSSGWIDLHTHAFPQFPPYCADPDDIGFKTGVTTVVDAGTCGADHIDSLYELSMKRKTRVLSFLNIARCGLEKTNELTDLNDISEREIEKAVQRYPSFIVGLKARMSASVVGSNNLEPLRLAKAVSYKLNKPLMVHIGSAPPLIKDILDLLDERDIITHCYNGKDNQLFTNEGKPIQALIQARKRGVSLDVGHGSKSFSFRVSEEAARAQIPFDTISTDIYSNNQLNGPVFNMATTLTKCLTLGYSLASVIRAVTETPAKLIGRTDIGHLRPGAKADLTLFKVEKDTSVSLVDSHGVVRQSKGYIKPFAVYLGGQYYEL
ncbi:amidohydrolase/deacetylase family metallohydrolase [Bacillus sp. Marseille-P3800]|uniref:amidohydrolase/deacetylase family metallohydrolase n=1 Tax=Bacillus sp. Marseille-P3800 TaxID=2014782 RepID=UPI000C078A3B|nr:amidohydrolase/deacetylase family metallohydrolase [Bacillus sp. Marseille-P3800]